MYIKTGFMNSLPVLGAAVVACALFTGSVAAQDQEFTVAFHVNMKGLDLSQPADARDLYSRIQHAARVVCTHGMRVDLVPSPDPQACYEKALGNAVRAANSPLLAQVYLATHTLRQAEVLGIDVPSMIAAR